MSTVEDAGVIDGGGVRPSDGRLVLRIYDPLGWDDARGHVAMLTRKLETYADFVTSGQASEHFPGRSAAPPVISVVFAEEPPAAVDALLRRAADRLATAGMQLESLVRSDP